MRNTIAYKTDKRNTETYTAVRPYRHAATVMTVFLLVIAFMTLMVSAAGYLSENNAVQRNTEGVAGGAYEVTSYDMQVTVGKDHTYDVEEDITVNIPDSLQQIEFSIPSGSFRIRGIDIPDTTYIVNNASSGSSVKIVDPQSLSTGLHTYNLRYKIYEFADRNDSHDIFYFNVLLPEWRQPIGELRAVISFPDDFPWNDMQYYAGQFGVQDTENRLTYDENRSDNTITITGEKIPENFGITLKDELPDGYWEGALDGVWAIFMMLFVMGAVVLILLVMWLIGGRDPKIRRVPQTRPLEDVSPVEFGYVFNNKFGGRDLVRMIIYFAIKGYLRISEYEPKRYRLYRLKDPDGEEKLLRTAYGILFEDVYKNRALDMDDIGERLLRIEHAIRDDVAAGFTAKDMQAYTPLSRSFRIAGIILIGAGTAFINALRYSYQYISVNFAESILIGLIVAALTASLCAAVDRRDSSSGETGRTIEAVNALLLTGVIIYLAVNIVRATGHILTGLLMASMLAAAVFLAVIMRARGKGNTVMIMKLRQLRRFISHPTPREILENYLADPGYYYDMLIYALTFGAEESWAISFLTLDVPAPEWYVDETEGHAFSNMREETTTVDFARDMRAFVRIIEGAYDEMLRHRRRY